MPHRVNVILAVGVLLLGLAGASLFRRPPTPTAPSGRDPDSFSREMRVGSRGPPLPGGPVTGTMPPTAIPSYYARQPERPNPPLPRSARLPAVLDRLYEARSPMVPVEPDPPLAEGVEAFSRMHRIADGDTLPALAARYLGDARRWVELFQANRRVLSDPAILPLGVELKVPAR